MKAGQTILTAEDLRLIAADDDGVDGWIYHGNTPLMALPLAPTWRETSPLFAATLAVRALRPTAPTLDMTSKPSHRGPGGVYLPGVDIIQVFHADKMSKQCVSEVMFHETCHAAGHPKRLDRYNVRDGHAPMTDVPAVAFADLGPFERLEEAVANIAGYLVCIRMGVEPRCGLSPFEWLPQVGSLPLEIIQRAITNAKATVGYIFGHDEHDELQQGNAPRP